MANDTSNYPDFVFVTYDEDFSAQTHEVAVSLEAGSLVGVPVKYVRHDLNNRPAPADIDTELKTAGHMVSHDAELGSAEEAVVYRSQAEAIIAAERVKLEATAKVGLLLSAEIDRLKAENERLTEKAIVGEYMWTPAEMQEVVERAEKSEADNAALTARVKELEAELGQTVRKLNCDNAEQFWKAIGKFNKRAEALETQLAAAKKALEFISGIGFVAAKDAPAHHDEAVKVARAALEVKT